MSAEQDRGSDASGYGVVQRPYLLGGCDVRSLLPCAWRRPAGAGIEGNDAVMHGVAEELRKASVEGVDIRVGPPLAVSWAVQPRTSDGLTEAIGTAPKCSLMSFRCTPACRTVDVRRVR